MMTAVTGRALVTLVWTLALVQVLTIQPAPRFGFPEPRSGEHWLLAGLFLLTSLGLVGAGRRWGVAAHAGVVAFVLALHPLTWFGRDGSAVVLMIWLGLLLARLPIRREWVLLFGSSMVALLATEALIAAFRPDDPQAGLPDYGAVMGEYGDCGFLRPSLTVDVVGEDRPARFVTNSLGLRYEREVTSDRPADTMRVLLAGDSFVAGYRTDQAETVGARLEAELGARLGRPVEVLPAGAGHPGASLDIARRCLALVTPDLFVVGITLGNDVSQSWFEERGLPASALDDLFLPPDASKSPAGLLPLKLLRSVRSWRFVRRIDALVHPQVIASWYEDAPTSLHLFDPLHSLGHFFVRRTLAPVEESFGATGRYLAEIAVTATEAGVPVMFVLLPQRFQVSDREWDATLFEYGLAADAFDWHQPNDRLMTICREAGLSCLDLLPAFREAATAGEPLYLPRGDMHWNRRGHEVAARALAAFIPSAAAASGSSSMPPPPEAAPPRRR